MHGSFISFTKRGLNTCVLLGISSGVTTLSEVTNFLGSTTCQLLGISSGMTTLSEVTNSLSRIACSAGSICVKGAGRENIITESTCTGDVFTRAVGIGGARGDSIMGAGIRGAGIRDTWFGNTYTSSDCVGSTSAKDACIEGIDVRDTCAGIATSAKNACIGGIYDFAHKSSKFSV